jgi:glycerophosphoryl diester phosphodiesterase
MTDVIAHRGANRAARENTVAAFRAAVALGAHGIELDVRRCAGGDLVVHHDVALDDGRVLAETPRGELPDHVPDLRTALDACDGAWVNVEIKNDPSAPDFDAERAIADDVVALALDVDVPSRWLISSFDFLTIERVRAVHDTIPTAWLVVQTPDDAVQRLVAGRHDALHPWVGTLQRDTIDRAHAVGLAVNTWTCNDPEQMGVLVGWGVDGICTDVPDVALTLVAGR